MKKKENLLSSSVSLLDSFKSSIMSEGTEQKMNGQGDSEDDETQLVGNLGYQEIKFRSSFPLFRSSLSNDGREPPTEACQVTFRSPSFTCTVNSRTINRRSIFII